MKYEKEILESFDIIGFKHRDNQVHSINRILTEIIDNDYRNIVFMTTMALSSLVDTFVQASYIFGNRHDSNAGGYTHKERMKIGQVALAFISGTGLNIMIEYYKLDYNADEIRNQFFGIFKISV